MFNPQNKTRNTDLESMTRKLGHHMEKKINLWWDTNTFERYIRENIVPRRLRWEVPPNDGLTDKESMAEWFAFFNNKSIEGLKFLLERKLRKTALIEQQIEEIKQKMEPLKETTEFKRLATQLNKDLIAKDLEVQNRKKKKYQRDITDYKTDQVFKWQSKVEPAPPTPTYSTPEREVRIQDPTTSHALNPPRWEERERRIETPRPYRDGPDPNGPNHTRRDERDTYGGTPRNNYNQRNNYGYGQHTPKRGGKKPFKKPFRNRNWQQNERNPRENRTPPYHDYRDGYGRTPIPTYNRFDPIRDYQEQYYENLYHYGNQQNYNTQRPFLERDRRDYSPRRLPQETHHSPRRRPQEEQRRNTLERREDKDQGRDSKRKREQLERT